MAMRIANLPIRMRITYPYVDNLSACAAVGLEGSDNHLGTGERRKSRRAVRAQALIERPGISVPENSTV